MKIGCIKSKKLEDCYEANNSFERKTNIKFNFTEKINKMNKHVNNISKKNDTFGNITNIFNYLIIINIISLIFSKDSWRRIIYSKYSYIELKINKYGYMKVFSSNSYYYCSIPDEIHINGVNQSEIQSFYDLNESDNNITLIFKNNINTTFWMFYECSNITEINLKNLETSYIEDMSFMFDGCSSLKSLDLSNFNTSRVVKMHATFYGCSTLISLNLANFDTRQVTEMQWIFSSCSSLEYINLNNSIINDEFFFIFKRIIK